MNYQVALITGAANGIGRAVALELARAGVAIAAVDIHREGLESLADQLLIEKRRCAWVVADVTHPAQLREAVDEVEQKLGPIDLAIANAGIGTETSGLNFLAEEMNKIIGVNLLGVSNTIAAVLPGMLSRKRGHLTAISSLAAFRGMPRMLGYCASKAGVNALMEGLRVELKPHGILVTTICPGWIRTAMTAMIDAKVPGILEPADAARHIVRAIGRKKSFASFPASMVWQLRILGWIPSRFRDALLIKLLGNLQRKG